MNTERERLLANVPGRAGWQHWGPYLSERQWGTVREDYSAGGTAWDYFPHEHARSRAYRWGEDGIAGISDAEQLVCLSLALWNGRDPILKERLFGLTNAEGNHGEDVKEEYFYLDATPSHSYLKMLYKYRQAAFPYADLMAENARRDTEMPEYELIDTGAFAQDRYFDVFVEYAQAEPGDVLMLITAWNRGPDAAPLHLIPQLVLRNTWSWNPGAAKPTLRALGAGAVGIEPDELGVKVLYAEGAAELLFTENESNAPKLWNIGQAGYFKDGFHERIVDARLERVNPEAHRHQGRRVVPVPGAARRQGGVPAAPDAPRARPAVRRLRAALGGAAHRGRSVLPRPADRHRLGGCARDPAPGICRHDLEQAVLPHRHSALAQGRSGPDPAARGAPQRPQQRVAASQQRRHRLDAG